jgi:hypothetical protein
MKRTLASLALLFFGWVAFALSPQAANKPTSPAPPGVWIKLNDNLNTAFSRAGDTISATLQEEVIVKDVKLPKGTKITGAVVTSVSKDKVHPHAGFVLLFDKAVLKDGTTLPVKVTMTSLAGSLADDVTKVDAGSGDVTDATMRAANVMGGLADPNESNVAHSETNLNGQTRTSSIKGVALFPSTSGNSGVVVGDDQQLNLSKWTRICVLVGPQ